MARLRRSDPSRPGISRRRCGRGFTYVAPDGSTLRDSEAIDRIRSLAIPPAWTDVWICPEPNGHLQALGTDQAGRRQYLYHPQWRARRDQQKWERLLEFARLLPALRERVQRDLRSSEELTRERVLACATRLLDRGLFRIGSEQYADANGTFGLATVRREHVSIEGNSVTFDYPAKHGKRRVQRVLDEEVVEVVRKLCARRSGGEELLAWRDEQGWVDVRSEDINDYVKDATGGEFTAKDFRSWHGTVLCAVALAVTAQADGLRGGSAANAAARARVDAPTRRKVARAVKEVSWYLGNTPAVCRASYIDPRVIDRYLGGNTIKPAMQTLAGLADVEQPDAQLAIEAAVLELLGGRTERTIHNAAKRVLEEALAAPAGR